VGRKKGVVGCGIGTLGQDLIESKDTRRAAFAVSAHKNGNN